MKKIQFRAKHMGLLLLLFFLPVMVMAQNIAIRGLVKDQTGEPVPGANVFVKGTTSGTITDMDGKYSINAPSNATLVFSFIGFTTEEVAVEGKSIIDVTLQDDAKELGEVVAVGYGTMKKSDLTGSVASVKGDDLKNLVTTDAGAALQGKASGVQIINGGAPGSGAEIRVRGYSSNSGNIGPLLIVDGLKVDNIQYLDPSMIKSMEVLKDAASAAIYGAQAGNGVVIITTKSGDKGDGHITYSMKAAMQSLGKKAELFNASEYKEYHKYLGDLDIDENETNSTDWYDEVFETTWSFQHSLTAQGGNDRGHFLASFNIVKNDGIVKGDKDTYKRITGQVNADYKFFDWFNVSNNLSIEKWQRTSVGNGYQSFLNAVVSIDPLTPAYVYSEDDMGQGMKDRWNTPTDPATPYIVHGNVMVPSNYTEENPVWYGTSKYVTDATANPLAMRDRVHATNGGVTVRGTFAANIVPTDFLTFTSRLGYRINHSNSHDWGVPFWLSSLSFGDNYSISASTNAGLYYQWENFLNFNKTFGLSSVGAMVGMSFTKNHNDNTNVSASDKAPILAGDGAPNFRYINYLNDNGKDKLSGGNVPSDATELAYFGRVTYSYDSRYSVQANFRADAFDSSKLSNKARWGYFPSFSAGWTISNESFFKDNVSENIVSFLKVRGSWGRNGNVSVLNGYKYASTIGEGGYYQFNPAANSGEVSTGAAPSGIPNPDLQWETSEQLDLGLDARFLNDRLTFGLDFYKKTTKDLLVNLDPIPELGVSKMMVNTGSVLNQGLDIELGWKDHIGDFKYSVNANASTLKNEVQEVSPIYPRIEEVGISGFNNKMQPTFEKGHKVWYFRGYKYAGVNAETGKPLYYDKDGKKTDAPVEDDKADLGAAIPTFTYGVTINLEYKGFDLTVFGTGATGNKIYNLMVSADRTQLNGINTYWKDSWKQPGDNAKYPDMKAVAADWLFFSSSAAVFDGSFFKIKQIQLGYTVPKSITKKALINDLRFSVSLDDYFTFTKYPGADPETSSLNSGASRGFDNGNYPMSKKVVFGVNLTF